MFFHFIFILVAEHVLVHFLHSIEMCVLGLLLLCVQGVLEAVRISLAGYPTRRTYSEFVDRFGILAPEFLDGR